MTSLNQTSGILALDILLLFHRIIPRNKCFIYFLINVVVIHIYIYLDLSFFSSFFFFDIKRVNDLLFLNLYR